MEPLKHGVSFPMDFDFLFGTSKADIVGFDQRLAFCWFSRWWFRFVFAHVHPYLKGNDPIWRSYFSNGLVETTIGPGNEWTLDHGVTFGITMCVCFFLTFGPISGMFNWSNYYICDLTRPICPQKVLFGREIPFISGKSSLVKQWFGQMLRKWPAQLGCSPRNESYKWKPPK